jgi:hypothetical protein
MSGMKLQPPLSTNSKQRHVTETSRAASAVSASRRVNWVSIANLGVKLLRNVTMKHVQGTTARHSSSSLCTCTSFPPGTKVGIGIIVKVHECNAEEIQYLFKTPTCRKAVWNSSILGCHFSSRFPGKTQPMVCIAPKRYERQTLPI